MPLQIGYLLSWSREIGSELERGYAYGLIKYIEEGPAGAATAFRKVADQFPNDLQAGVFAALFSRGGYDISGDATPDQVAAEKILLELIEKHPKNPVPLNALLIIRAEAPDLVNSLEMAPQSLPDDAGLPAVFPSVGTLRMALRKPWRGCLRIRPRIVVLSSNG